VLIKQDQLRLASSNVITSSNLQRFEIFKLYHYRIFMLDRACAGDLRLAAGLPRVRLTRNSIHHRSAGAVPHVRALFSPYGEPNAISYAKFYFTAQCD
jgi:hypothetical protein